MCIYAPVCCLGHSPGEVCIQGLVSVYVRIVYHLLGGGHTQLVATNCHVWTSIRPMGHYLLKGHYSAHEPLFAQGALFSPWATVCSRGTIQPMGHYSMHPEYIEELHSTLVHEPNCIYLSTTHTQQSAITTSPCFQSSTHGRKVLLNLEVGSI